VPPAPKKDAPAPQPREVVEADELLAAYVKNEGEAAAKYGGRELVVRIKAPQIMAYPTRVDLIYQSESNRVLVTVPLSDGPLATKYDNKAFTCTAEIKVVISGTIYLEGRVDP
jgi:hypothetical protein